MKVLLTLILLCISVPSSSDPFSNRATLEAADIESSPRIQKIVFAANRLWILNQNGRLQSLNLKEGGPQEVAPEKFVFDIYHDPDKQLYVLAGGSRDTSRMHVWRRTETTWIKVTEIPIGPGEAVLGLHKYRDSLLVLTDREIHLQEGPDKWRSIAVKGEIRGAYQTAFAVTDDGYVYVGINRGEWGGGLFQVNLKSGEVKQLKKVGKPKSCEGPLNPECDPVTGVIRDPENPSCVIASIGLRHFLEHGRLVRVCNQSISVVFSKSYRDISSKKDANVDTVFVDNSTEAIFDLVAEGQGYWAVTGRGIYHFTLNSEPTFQKLPNLVNRSGLHMSDAIPNVIVVSTDINWARSLSGHTPLIAVKE